MRHESNRSTKIETSLSDWRGELRRRSCRKETPLSTMSSFTATIIAFLISLISVIVQSNASSSTSSPAICPVRPYPFLSDLQTVSPLNYSLLNFPIQVDVDLLDRTVAKLKSGSIAVLFHASWCPFSREARPMFETLSFMFPEIEHLTIEQSSAMPSVLSRYGVHSFPAILIVSHSSTVRYCGPRNLSSLVEFYRKTIGAEPVQYLTTYHLMSQNTNGKTDTLAFSISSLKEMYHEPCLAFSMLFIVLRLLHFALPTLLACAKSVWHRFVIPQMNWEIFGETSQIFGQALHMINVKRFWTKLKVCKTRNFHQRARSARVWASSIASVSVGEN